jgi:hypothetical protein
MGFTNWSVDRGRSKQRGACESFYLHSRFLCVDLLAGTFSQNLFTEKKQTHPSHGNRRRGLHLQACPRCARGVLCRTAAPRRMVSAAVVAWRMAV